MNSVSFKAEQNWDCFLSHSLLDLGSVVFTGSLLRKKYGKQDLIWVPLLLKKFKQSYQIKNELFYEFWKNSVRLFAQAFVARDSFSRLWNLCFPVLPGIRKICHKRGRTHHPAVNASLKLAQCSVSVCKVLGVWFLLILVLQAWERWHGMWWDIYHFPANTYMKQVL